MNYTPNQTVKYYLNSQGLTQAEAAIRMGLGRPYLNLVLNGRRPINREFLGYFWHTFVFEASPFFLPTASEVLDVIAKHVPYKN